MSSFRPARPLTRPLTRFALLAAAALALAGCVYEPGYGYGYAGPPVVVSPGWGWWGHGDWHGGWRGER